MTLQVRTPAQAAPKPSLSAAAGNLLQRQCACGGTPGPSGECEACRKKRLGTIPLAPANPVNPTLTNAVPPIVQDVLRSSGQPLDPATRDFMEPRFGHDFSQVRVHTDAKAEESAQAVNALAYTIGRNVVFGAGQYRQGANDGMRLLAHELTHVVQQSTPGSAGETSALEAEAHAIGDQVWAGHGVSI